MSRTTGPRTRGNRLVASRTRANRTIATRTRANGAVTSRTRTTASGTGSSARPILLLLLGLLLGTAGWIWFALPSEAELTALRTSPVESSALMETRVEQARQKGRKLAVQQQWVELDQVAPLIISAVIASEDARFFEHEGLDLREIHAAIRADVAMGRKLRGASTLTQQVVKNLYLSEKRSLLRKLEEALLAARVESALDKERILTIYLNIAEWGDGVFGIEAASRRHLKKPAARVELHEAAALVAMLPNPLRLAPDRRPAELHRRALRVLKRMQDEGMISGAESDAAKVSLERWLGRPAAIN